MAETDAFYASLPLLRDFAEAVREANYRALPEDWLIGVSDVVGSTEAIAQGRYKTVNLVGAGVIAAVANTLGRRPFPFVFGGDGASLAVAPDEGPRVAEALAAMAAFTQAEFGLGLRVALVPVREIRAAGRDVRVARFAASEACHYAMFMGGGLTWVEERAKQGAYAVPPVRAEARPDLSGLSCRWGVAPARHGLVLSLIVVPRGSDPRFAALLDDIVGLVREETRGAGPVTGDALRAGDPRMAIGLEAATLRAGGRRGGAARLRAAFNYALTVAFNALRLRAGGFDGRAYAAEVAANADFRKIDDGLRMTLDCTPGFADRLEARLAEADAFADWGTHRQASAQITCFVPSISDRGHIHFVDGAGGGYTLASAALKARRAARRP